MEQIRETIENSRKIVIKIGSNVLSNENGTVDKKCCTISLIRSMA